MWEPMLSNLNRRARGLRAIAAIGLLCLGPAVMAAQGDLQVTLVDWAREAKRDSLLAAITSPDVDVNVKSADGSTALMWAASAGRDDLVDLLIRYGADVNLKDASGRTAANYADGPRAAAIRRRLVPPA